jgi:hypothetical protein
MKDKILIQAMTIIAVTVLMASCKKEAGPAGTNGKDGNANVKVYLFGPKVMSSTSSGYFQYLPLRHSQVDSVVVLAYHKAQDYWFSTPGLGLLNAYNSRLRLDVFGTLDSTEASITISNVDGTSYTGPDVLFQNVKFVVIPASTVVGKKEDVDFSDYKATMNYFGLPE